MNLIIIPTRWVTKSKIIVPIKIVFLCIFAVSVTIEAQNNPVLDKNDYTLLNNELNRKIMSLQFRDSLREVLANRDSLSYKHWLLRMKDFKPFDTLLLKSWANTDLYKYFVNKGDYKFFKFNKQFEFELKQLYTKIEIENFKKQLKPNNLSWQQNKIDSFLPVLVHDSIQEIKLEKYITPEEYEKYGRVRNLYWVIGKPIYSINKNYAIIGSRTSNSFFFSFYKKIKNQWVFQFTVSRHIF